MNSVRSLPDGVSGIAAASGGNHGAAAAWAAASAGLAADVFAPATSTPAKLERIEEYGARLHAVDGDVGAALDACHAFSEREGVPVLHPYDTFETVSGAGTLGLELAEQVPDADRVVIACGGGGLYAGVATALAGQLPVQPVEPELCPHLHDALAAGEPVARPSSGVAADALGPPRIGEHAFAVATAQDATSLLVRGGRHRRRAPVAVAAGAGARRAGRRGAARRRHVRRRPGRGGGDRRPRRQRRQQRHPAGLRREP